ncbi:hypothetical protein HML84_16460 [Alcanivorax sp. IO_7]|nr:hypothetical protein HML84_16460 [Alcanivorax sp. IO_7]
MMALAVSVGWMLLFFPALWIYARLCFAPFRLMLRDEGPLQSLQSAFERSSSCQWPLLLTLVLSGLLVFALAAVVNSVVIGLLGENPGTLLVTGLITGLLATLVNVVAFRFWMLADARRRRRPRTEPAFDDRGQSRSYSAGTVLSRGRRVSGSPSRRRWKDGAVIKALRDSTSTSISLASSTS